MIADPTPWARFLGKIPGDGQNSKSGRQAMVLGLIKEGTTEKSPPQNNWKQMEMEKGKREGRSTNAIK
jgi:hypothetical protein